MTDLDAWVPLAEIARPHGVRGELRLRVFNKTSDVLLEQDEVLVRLPDGEEHEVSVERARRADDAILVKLYSVDDRDRAEDLRGALVCVRRRDFPPPEEGEFYTIDILGAEVRVGGARVGEAIEVITYPTLEALVVKADDGKGTWEVPLTEAYVENLDVPGKRVDLRTLDEIELVPPRKPKAKRDAAPKAPPPSSEGDG